MSAGREGGDDITTASDKLADMLGGPLPEEGDEEENSQSPNPGDSDDAPVEGPASGEEDEAVEPDEAIDPPSSWDAAAKAKFKALPRDMQELVSQRERERDNVTSSKLQEAAQVRKAVEARAQETEQMRGMYEQRLVQLARHLESTIPEEFKQIRNASDLVRLADTNPALVTKFTAWQQQAASVAGELHQIEQQRQYEAAAKNEQVLASEYERAAERWPEFVSPDKGPVIRNQITSYAKEIGYEQHEIDMLQDHRLLLILKDALDGRRLRASMNSARSKADAKPLPRVVRPGSGEQAGRGGTDKAGAVRIAKSGDLNRISDQLARMLQNQ